LNRPGLAHKDKGIVTLHALMIFGPSLETNLRIPATINAHVAKQVLAIASNQLVAAKFNQNPEDFASKLCPKFVFCNH
jgi:hypothetical protein